MNKDQMSIVHDKKCNTEGHSQRLDVRMSDRLKGMLTIMMISSKKSRSEVIRDIMLRCFHDIVGRDMIVNCEKCGGPSFLVLHGSISGTGIFDIHYECDNCDHLSYEKDIEGFKKKLIRLWMELSEA